VLLEPRKSPVQARSAASVEAILQAITSVALYSVSSDLDAVKIVQQMGSRFNDDLGQGTDFCCLRLRGCVFCAGFCSSCWISIARPELEERGTAAGNS
jgi:hypothetical protein